MNFDELKAAWQCQGRTDFAALSPEALLERLKTEQRTFNRVMFWSDVFVAGIYVAVVVFMFVSLSGMGIDWPFHLGAVLILMAASYHPWRNRRRKRKERQFGNSLRDELKKKSRQLDYQIRLARWDAIWGYYLPTLIALNLFTWQMVLNGHLGIVEFQRAALFFILLLGGLGYGVGGVGIRKAAKEKREVDRELKALACPVAEEETPPAHRVARTLLLVGTLASCGYLLVQILTPEPGAGKPIQPASSSDGAPRFAKVAPFTAVRWDPESEVDQPIVRVRGEWLRLTAIDGIPVDRLMETARDRFGDLARKRFAEDLVEVLAAAGHDPGWTVTLLLDRGDGKEPVALEEEMTEKKRKAAREYRQ